MVFILIRAVNFFIQLLIYLILAGAILSWFARGPYGSLYQIYSVINRITEPILAPCRRLLYRFGLGGTVDFSPVLAILLLSLLDRVIISILGMILI
ncbi:MAG TPA: YggT family protein [Bacillota bacterium]|nr:YggT family protein [Bacillota bacterium]